MPLPLLIAPFVAIAKFIGVQVVGAIRHAQMLTRLLGEVRKEADKAASGLAQISIRTTVHLKHNRLPAISRALGPAMDAAAKEVVELIVAEAKKRAPVRTGELRDGIVWVKVARGYEAQSTAPHSGYINSGTRHMAAQPFWDQAVLVGEMAAPEIFRKHMQRALRAG